MRCPLSRAAALACASIAVSDTDNERSSFIVTGACGRLSNAAAWACASAGFGDTAVCESASAAVVAKIAGIRIKCNFMGVLVEGKGMDVSSRVRCGLAGCDGVSAMRVPRALERENAGYQQSFAMAAHDSPRHARSRQQAAAIIRGISRAA
jgi:hypothetical protein